MKNDADLYIMERELLQKGYSLICGIDEAGCGPLAGPVYAAAVILDPANVIEGLNDSKKLSERKREELFGQIREKALAWSVASASEGEIDEINILQARLLAMRRAVSDLKLAPELALVDGNRDPSLGIETLCVVRGDAKSASVAAASVLAKVSRDRYMKELASKYPEYLFEVHKGYPTKMHIEKILQHGECPAHRKSFLKKIYAREKHEDADRRP